MQTIKDNEILEINELFFILLKKQRKIYMWLTVGRIQLSLYSKIQDNVLDFGFDGRPTVHHTPPIMQTCFSVE